MGWKNLIPHKKVNQEELMEKAKEEMIRRDERFKANWQNYHDEHSEE